MASDQNKKTLRHFQCRDYLWEIFDQMSLELECSTDYLINEAMRQYARSRNYASRSGMPSQASIPPVGGSPKPDIPSAPPPPPEAPQSVEPAQAYGPSGYGGSPEGGGAYGPPSYQSNYGGAPSAGYSPPEQGAGAVTNRPPAMGPPPQSAPPQPPPGAPPPLPGGPPPSASGAMPPLFVVFNGQRIPISKPEFVIGRGSKSADLAIKDGNISRRHAAVVFENGAFFIKDLGSTNGIEANGQRVDNQPIYEGAVFHLCDYELKFTYQ